MVTWESFGRASDTILAVWPKYYAKINAWVLDELVDKDAAAPEWRRRCVPTDRGGVRLEVYPTQALAYESSLKLNAIFAQQLDSRSIPESIKRSQQLKVAKLLQSRERLREEEALMLAEAIKRNAATAFSIPVTIELHPSSEPFRNSLLSQLQVMPYLRIALVQADYENRLLVQLSPGSWSQPYSVSERDAQTALRARIANGFGFEAHAHWGKTKAKIRDILLPRANQLLQLASVQRMLAEALARGCKMLVCNGVVFWYEDDGAVGWEVKQAATSKESEGATVWHEGTIYSTNHGRLVILPYIKENGEHVRGHTKNGPNDGRAEPRHPNHYVEIPFEQLEGDLMIELYGQLPYE